MGVPGGKEREEACCPVCGNLIYSGVTDGWYDTSIVSLDDTEEFYKRIYLQRHHKM